MLNQTVDTLINFGKVTVSTGYNDTDTIITLSSGEGSKLPDTTTKGSYNLTWWNATNYQDPTDDPNKEIVRVLTILGDTIVVIRGQEETTASIKNLSGIYKMIMAITAKTISDLQLNAQSRVDSHSVLTTGIHGVGTDTVDGITARNNAISTHASLTTNVHNFDSSGNAPPQLHGGEAHKGNVISTTSTYYPTLSDDTILCDTSTSPITINLPSISSRAGKLYEIKKIDSSSNNVIITPSGTDKIESITNLTIVNQWDYYTIRSTPIGWIILASPAVITLQTLGESMIVSNTGVTDNLRRNETITVTN